MESTTSAWLRALNVLQTKVETTRKKDPEWAMELQQKLLRLPRHTLSDLLSSQPLTKSN